MRVIVPGALEHLAADGALLLEIGTDQGDAVRALCETAGYAAVEIRRDLAAHDRIIIAHR